MPVRFSVEPSPSGGYFVRLAGGDAPVSRHYTEEEAEEAAASYDRGVRENRVGDLQRLPYGREVLVRAVRPEDKPLFASGWERFGAESVRVKATKPEPPIPLPVEEVSVEVWKET